MIETKYGPIPSSAFNDYRDSLISRIWILLPLKEENCPTLTGSIERLNRELHGMLRMGLKNNEYIITIMNLLENSISEDNFSAYRSDILRCCELVKKLNIDNNMVNNGGDLNV